MIDLHSVAAVASSLGGFLGVIFYIRAVLAGETKPHIFTWIIWATLNIISAAVSFSEGAFLSGFVLGSYFLGNISTAIFGFRNGDKYIKRSDIVAFIVSFSIIPLWFFSGQALLAAFLATLINACSCYPTFRKAWILPFEENKNVFSFYTVTSFLGVVAVTPFTLTAALYPAVIFMTNAALVGLIIWRRCVYLERRQDHVL